MELMTFELEKTEHRLLLPCLDQYFFALDST